MDESLKQLWSWRIIDKAFNKGSAIDELCGRYNEVVIYPHLKNEKPGTINSA